MVKSKKEKIEKSKRARKIWKWVIWVTVGLVLVGAIVSVLVWWNLEGSKTDLEKRGLPDRGVPVMEISLADGLELSEIDGGSKETKYEGNELDLYDTGMKYEFDNVEIKGRGNTTWGKLKNPYRIKFTKNVDLLELGKAKKWVLLANYFDASYLRNDIAFMLAEMVEVPYSRRGDFVELYIDGDYRGLYYLIQQIEIAKGSVDLRNEGGLLFEVDTLHKDGENCYMTYFGECLVLRDKRTIKDEEDSLADDFLADLNKAEIAAKKGNYNDVEKVLDIESFVKYFLVNEFTVNPDAYTSSFYLYRNDEGKIAAGPVWDFDYSLANREWTWWTDENFFSPDEDMVRRRNAFGEDDLEEDLNTSRLFYYLMETLEFQSEVKRIYKEKMFGKEESFMQAIRNKAGEIYWAAKADGRRWEKEGFEEELMEMMGWIKKRYEHFEQVYGGDESGSSGVI